jgi:FlaG/FlaF family flagellin (archaellin)
LIAVCLRIGGTAIIGVITAVFAAWLLEHVREVEEGSSAARQDVERVSGEGLNLQRTLEASQSDRVPVVPEGQAGA